LRPGYLIPVQPSNSSTALNGTKLLTFAPIDLVVNRDADKHASGKLFLDEGLTVSELTNKEYIYYNFLLNGKSLVKEVVNDNTSPSKYGTQLGKLVIADAADLQSTDFACYFD